MSKSQQKRICTQSKCAYRDALEQQLAEKKDIILIAALEIEKVKASHDNLKADNARLRDAANVALGHLTGGMDGDWRDCDPEPEFGDGHDCEGFAGGCERMGCPCLDKFEEWLRTACFQKPTYEAYDLAKLAWKEAMIQAHTNKE